MYIVCKNINLKTISGYINLPIDTELTEHNNLLFLNDKPICYTTSQNCYDYMANNNDNNGKLRYELIQNIKTAYNDIIKKDNEKYNDLIADLNEDDDLPAYESTLPFTINFNYEFYNSTIDDLRDILRRLDING